ncbi:hypothetical protein FACS1894172_07050 [Spirochaetia bacterium]|nr:hypothetical protein FACS1894164_08760 [Spirochaetia bacterium]GHU31704.1 hypothetical protein FACS1894172_07050 [Spirochaetia bacterium]
MRINMHETRRAIITRLLRVALQTICKIDDKEFIEAIRGHKNEQALFPGPMIIAINHTNFLEVPMLVTQSYPKYLTGIVKGETWQNPVMGFLMNTYDAIPINRAGSYLQTFRHVHTLMKDKKAFVVIAPEGTRSGTGILGPGKAGIVQLALLTGAPVLPVIFIGGEKIWINIRHFRRTRLQFRVGRPFRFKYEGRPSKEIKDIMLNELMGQIAALLPVEKQGQYVEQALREPTLLEFL